MRLHFQSCAASPLPISCEPDAQDLRKSAGKRLRRLIKRLQHRNGNMTCPILQLVNQLVGLL